MKAIQNEIDVDAINICKEITGLDLSIDTDYIYPSLNGEVTDFSTKSTEEVKSSGRNEIPFVDSIMDQESGTDSNG